MGTKEGKVMRKIGVVLSGCGVMDGSEIHEAVSLIIALDSYEDVEIQYLAPRGAQHHVIRHDCGEEETGARRCMIEEASRIARGPVTPLDELDPGELAGLCFPGGFGAAKNLCDYAFRGKEMQVREDVRHLIEAMVEQGKPLLAVCIAPAILARVLGSRRLRFTIGNDPETVRNLESFGAQHVETDATGVCVDEALRVVTGPAYMLASGPSEVYTGIANAVDAFMALVNRA